MSQLKDFIEIDKKFQNSINLQLDIDNRKKLNSYIPTRSSINILNGFLENVINNKEKANILIGPYGKGKSHLLLVLLAVLKESEDKTTEKLLNKIEKISDVTANNARLIHKEYKPFLPVIISGTDRDLNHGFVLGLMEALKKNDLMDIAPDSDYSKAVEVIENWKNKYKKVYKEFENILIGYETNVKELEKSLKSMNRNGLEIFKKVYPELTAGSEFRPMVQDNAMTLYREISIALKEHGYGGIYIIFDEFSKYIEGHERETFAYDMKILQDMCELANNSKEQQIHITFVAHKSIKEYGNALPQDMINAFKGVEGRLKEIRFIVSAQNNYELLQHVIKKKGTEYKAWLKEENNSEIIKESYKIPCFQSMFKFSDYQQIVVKGAFPMLPLTAYALLNISEKVAQNERSIFTFLANDEKGSLVNLIENGADELLSVDVIYDYFKNLFKESISLTNIHNEWLKADYALTKAESLGEEKVIKAIAILHMINKNEEVPVKKEEIRLATGLSKEDFTGYLQKLENKEIVKYRNKLGIYTFKNNIGINLDKYMNQMIEKQSLSLNWAEEFANISELEYVLPKKYNREYTMTRFFKYVYMTQEQFLSVKNSNYLFDTYKADGLIVCIVMLKENDANEVKSHTDKLKDERIVVIYPKKAFGQQQSIRKLKAVKALLKDKNFIDENKVLQQELELYRDDLIFEINGELESLYMPENGNDICFYSGRDSEKLKFESEKNFNRFLSDICSSYYENAPKINNELINRQNVSAQIKKARNQIIDAILGEEDLSGFEKGTSSESTIFRATLVHTGIMDNNEYEAGCEKILKEIRDFIGKCAGKKTSFDELYSKIMGEKFGVRKGVIPIFLANEIVGLQDTPIIYLRDKEVDISSEILNNINEKPEEYFLFIEKENMEKEKYLNILEENFITEEIKKKKQSKMQRLSNIVESMHRWYRSIDQYTLTFTKQIFNKKEKGYIEEETFEKIKKFRKIFKGIELNPREVLFEKIPEAIYGNIDDNAYEKCTQEVLKIKKCMSENLYFTKIKTATDIKKIFGEKANDSLGECLKTWYVEQSEKAKSHIFSENITGFMTYIGQLKTNDELEIVSRVCKIISGIYINDWKNDSFEQFMDELARVKASVEAVKENNESGSGENRIYIENGGNKIERFYETDDDDSTSYFLQNAIEEALEEFGDTLELNQKVSVLAKALEDLLSK